MENTRESRKPFALLLWAVNPGGRRLAILAATLFGVWLCELTIPFLLGNTVDAAVSKAHGFKTILALGLTALAVSGVLYALHTIYLRAETDLVARATFRLRQHLYTGLLDQPLSFFPGRRKGELAHRLLSDTEVLDIHAIYLLADVPFALLTVFGVCAVMLWMQPALAVLVSAVLIGVSLLAQRLGQPLETLERSIGRRRARLGGKLQEALDAIRAVKSFGHEVRESQKLGCASEHLMRAEIGAGRIVARLEPLIQLTETFGFLAVVCYGAVLVFQGALSPGRLVAFIAYMELMREPIRDAAAYWAHYRKSAGMLARISDLLATFAPPPPRGDSSADGPLGIEICGVSYSYPGSGRVVLDDISLSVAPGETVAVVGENGAGKSTLMDLLLGLAVPDKGTIRAGGLPLGEWNPCAWRESVAAMPQEAVLFHSSIEENIRYGAPDAREDDLFEAARQSGLTPTLARLPRGLATMAGERGAKLSGGERQRIALARALIRKPRLLILDEPGAALDDEGANNIRRLLRYHHDERTTFLVTHDAQTIAMSDRVIVLEGGRLVCFCTPSELGSDGPSPLPQARSAA
jgi:ABC-type multidrug transport system fused ATPase/permease subunit